MIGGAAFRRQASSRAVVLAVIGLGHIGLVVALLNAADPKRKRTAEPELEPLIVTFLDEAVEAALPASAVDAPNVRGTRAERPVRAAQAVPRDAGESPVESESTAPALIPPIDWRGEVGRVAKDIVARQRPADVQAASGVAPKGLGPPPEPGKHTLGDTERREGGEVMDWINERCYYSNKPPPGPDLGSLRLNLPRCKRRQPAQLQDFETWRQLQTQGEPRE